jgi:hypothetical protein
VSYCRLATGASFGLRRLYTDQDEVLFQAARPILLNGIEEVISRPDLGDRAIFVTLPPTAEHDRRPERPFWQNFETTRPRILGSLLDAVAHGLRNLPNLSLEQLPRIADFALWATACETAFWPGGTFARVPGKPHSGDRRLDGRRSRGRSRAGANEKPTDMDRECFRPSACRPRCLQRQHCQRGLAGGSRRIDNIVAVRMRS